MCLRKKVLFLSKYRMTSLLIKITISIVNISLNMCCLAVTWNQGSIWIISNYFQKLNSYWNKLEPDNVFPCFRVCMISLFHPFSSLTSCYYVQAKMSVYIFRLFTLVSYNLSASDQLHCGVQLFSMFGVLLHKNI